MCTASCECSVIGFQCKEIPCDCYKSSIKKSSDTILNMSNNYNITTDTAKKRVVCPACLRHADVVKPRYAQMPHRDVVGYSYAKVLHLIGRIYYHNDGTVCDETLCTISTLTKPVYLQRMGSKNDPRIP